MILNSSIGKEISKMLTNLLRAFIVTFSLLLAVGQASEGAIQWTGKGLKVVKYMP